MKKLFSLPALMICIALQSKAQKNLSIENVRTVYLRSTGPIKTQEEVKGYYTFYESDKVDKKTNEYTLQIMDENLNKVKDVKFLDSKKVTLEESAYGNSNLAFKFLNQNESLYQVKVLGVDGQEKFEYTHKIDDNTLGMMGAIKKMMPTADPKRLFAVEDKGFISVYPVFKGFRSNTEIKFYSSKTKSEWTYLPSEIKRGGASYLGCTDNLVLFIVAEMQDSKMESWILGLNLQNGQKVFEVRSDLDQYMLAPMHVVKVKGTENFLIMGAYFNKKDTDSKAKNLGVGMWLINEKGKILNSKYNSWDTEISKVLSVDAKGKIDDFGYAYFHEIVETANGEYFAIAEGFRRKAQISVTNMLLLHFDQKFDVRAATIYEKNSNTIDIPSILLTPALQGGMGGSMSAFYGFDYAFTQMDKSRSAFSVGYTDYVKAEGYKGLTFNSISYYNGQFTTDKINLKTESGNMRIFPAKPGSLMIMEYFKKEKKIDMRLEKLN